MRNRKRALGGFCPFSTLLTAAVVFGLYGETDPNAGGGGGGAGGKEKPVEGAGAGAAGGGEENKPLPYEDARRLMQERDRAKIVNRTIVEDLGLEVAWVDDPANPGKQKAVVKGLDDLKTLRQQQTQAAEESRKKAGKWDEHKTELNRLHEQTVSTLTQTHTKMLTGRDAVINQLAVESPLREALTAENIVPEAMGDAVQLLKGRLKVTIETDEETGAAKPVVQPVGEDGKPLLDGKGNPITIRQFAAEFLSKKPHMQKANFRRGPGAGGYGSGAAPAGGGAGSPATGGAAAAQYMFGAALPQR